jgi:hypothetical protein
MTRIFTAAFFGLVLGLAGGLLYAWVIAPPEPDLTPASLRADHKTTYIQLVAQTFAADKDIDRARARLSLIGDAGSAQAVTALAQRTSASGGDAATVRALAALAAALGARPASPTPNLAPPPTETPVPTVIIEPTATLSPTLAPSPTTVPTLTPQPATGFEFVGKQLVCDSQLTQPLLQVVTFGAEGEQLPGVEVIVEWVGGFDHFFTGLKPELGEGYGDFTMTPGLTYDLHLVADPSAAVTGLDVPACPQDNNQTYAGSWQLVFRQP